MDFTLEGAKWWSLIVLDGYSRTMLAGMWLPPKRVGGPDGAVRRVSAMAHRPTDLGQGRRLRISDDVEAVCTRLGIDHRTITSTQGEATRTSWRRISTSNGACSDYQFSLDAHPLEFERAHQDFLQFCRKLPKTGKLRLASH
jgi:hypothetical protein